MYYWCTMQPVRSRYVGMVAMEGVGVVMVETGGVEKVVVDSEGLSHRRCMSSEWGGTEVAVV